MEYINDKNNLLTEEEINKFKKEMEENEKEDKERELIAQKVKSDRIESIRNLNLWGSNIEDISIIEEMPSLEIVSLSVNKIFHYWGSCM